MGDGFAAQGLYEDLTNGGEAEEIITVTAHADGSITVKRRPCPVCFDTKVVYWPIGFDQYEPRVCRRCS